MPSLNVDLEYFDHIKAKRLEARLGPGSDVLPIRLWAYVGKIKPDSGSIEVSAEELEHIIRWWGEKGAAIRALTDINFLSESNGKFKVHDWFDHSGHLAAYKKRSIKANKIRWGRYRDSRTPSRSPNGDKKESSCRAVPAVLNHTSRAVPAEGVQTTPSPMRGAASQASKTKKTPEPKAPDLSLDDRKEMHDQRVKALGPCRFKDCEFCKAKRSQAS